MSESNSSPLANVKVLLAEDYWVNRKVALKMLERMGIRAKSVENGAEVLEILEQESFDLILMDCQMPVMDGFETTRSIREAEGESGHHVPIIAMTAYTSGREREEARNAGMTGWLEKPILMDALEEVIREACGLS